jgi:CheY-like chemotaxis protein
VRALSLCGLLRPMDILMAKLILVVDDDDDMRKRAVELIESLGYRVASAMDGKEVLQRVTDDNIDAMLIGVMMPVVNGFQLAERVRTIRPDMPIICVTAYTLAIPDDRYCDGLLYKPYTATTIDRILRAVLAR